MFTNQKFISIKLNEDPAYNGIRFLHDSKAKQFRIELFNNLSDNNDTLILYKYDYNTKEYTFHSDTVFVYNRLDFEININYKYLMKWSNPKHKYVYSQDNIDILLDFLNKISSINPYS